MIIGSRALGILLLAATVVSASSSARAEAEGEVRELAEKFQESKKTVVDSESQKRRILGSLYTINKRMKRISRDKGQLTDELFHVQDNVQSIAKVIASLEKQIVEQRVRLRARLRALYKISGEGYVAMIFSQTSSHEMDQALKYLKIVTDADYRLIRSYQRNIAMYKDQRKKLKTQVERLVTLEKAIRVQENLLVEEHRAKTKIVSTLDASRVAAMKRIRKIRETTEALREREEVEDGLFSGLLKTSFFERKGQLAAPVVGTVVQDFGLIHDGRYKVNLSHKGWQYQAAIGAPVATVFDGNVVHSGWLNGYGNVIIIDHGDHYYTVYGHVAKPRVRSGDDVKKGQTIAEVGSSSRQYGDGIYFEIRHFSEPENPKAWLTERSLPVSSVQKHDPAELATAPRLGTE